MADDNLMSQDEIEALLNAGSGGAAAESPEPEASPPAEPPASSAPADDAVLDQSEIESLLNGGGGAAETPPAESAASEVSEGDDSDKLLGQDDIEKLLSQAGKSTPSAPAAKPAVAAKPKVSESPLPGEGEMPQGDIDYLLNQAEEALDSIEAEVGNDLPEGVAAFRLEDVAGTPASAENATIDLVRDVDLDLKIELGRTHMYLEDVLKLRKGSVVPLDKLAGDPVDIFVNGRLIARGDVLVLCDNFYLVVPLFIAPSDSAI